MTREEVITKALDEGRDPHLAAAAYFLGIPEEKVTPIQRQGQKNLITISYIVSGLRLIPVSRNFFCNNKLGERQ